MIARGNTINGLKEFFDNDILRWLQVARLANKQTAIGVSPQFKARYIVSRYGSRICCITKISVLFQKFLVGTFVST